MLPLFYTPDKSMSLLQSGWASLLNPILNSVLATPVLIQNVALSSTATTVVNHGLQKNLTGWLVVRNRSGATIWDTQDANSKPNLTLWLNASSAVKVDLLVF